MTVNHGNNGNSKGKARGDIDFLDFSLDDSDVVDFSLDDFDVRDNDEYEFAGLCVPQDPIEELEWFPNFKGEMISLNNFFRDDKKQSEQGGVRKRIVLSVKKNLERRDDEMVPSKKPRSKRVTSRDGSWSIFLPMKKEVDGSWSNYFLTTKKELEKSNGGAKKICMHCGADSTPLWRMGPLGPNTLCDACGVRYRTGRLVLEYRPLNEEGGY